MSAARVMELARARGLTLGTAESCTGGLVAAALVDVPGASKAFEGAVVAYSNRIKVERLHVPTALIEAHGAVSGEVAEAMAAGAVATLGVDVAVATTGIAGPGGGSAAKPVGTVWVAAHFRGETRSERFAFTGLDRAGVREATVEAALALVERVLQA